MTDLGNLSIPGSVPYESREDIKVGCVGAAVGVRSMNPQDDSLSAGKLHGPVVPPHNGHPKQEVGGTHNSSATLFAGK